MFMKYKLIDAVTLFALKKVLIILVEENK